MKIEYADLVNDPLELKMRSVIRAVLKEHKIVDGVIEADLTSAIKALAAPASAEPVAWTNEQSLKLLADPHNWHKAVLAPSGEGAFNIPLFAGPKVTTP